MKHTNFHKELGDGDYSEPNWEVDLVVAIVCGALVLFAIALIVFVL